MMHKIENKLEFSNKRDKNIITPCCHKTNKDNKFVTYKGYPSIYGYCHSCGTTNLPPTVYKNDSGENFIWNETTNKFEILTTQMPYNNVLQNRNTYTDLYDKNVIQKQKKQHTIDFEVVKKFTQYPKENNLLQYLRSNYTYEEVEKVKQMYYIGTNKKLWTVFWQINKNGLAQKAKVVLYNKNGKRTNYFKVPYKNEDGYNSCLFGEHLLKNNTKPIVLVESEKTTIVSAIQLINYTWLSYGGINGLTDKKLEALKNQNITIIPDISRKAVNIIKNKIPKMEELNIKANIFDMTDNLNDEELKRIGWYNCDIEDVFRSELSI
ncbi:DUF6371 domain-containing protein [Winogradskyella sp. PC D3.3]